MRPHERNTHTHTRNINQSRVPVLERLAHVELGAQGQGRLGGGEQRGEGGAEEEGEEEEEGGGGEQVEQVEGEACCGFVWFCFVFVGKCGVGWGVVLLLIFGGGEWVGEQVEGEACVLCFFWGKGGDVCVCIDLVGVGPCVCDPRTNIHKYVHTQAPYKVNPEHTTYAPAEGSPILRRPCPCPWPLPFSIEPGAAASIVVVGALASCFSSCVGGLYFAFV